MPEIKNNFIQGKMNKDLDDRLLPNGQYRDGINIKVSKSDSSDVGSVQNIKGNDYEYNSSHALSLSNTETIGHYVDSLTGDVFWFTTDFTGIDIDDPVKINNDVNSNARATNSNNCRIYHKKIGESLPSGALVPIVDNFRLNFSKKHPILHINKIDDLLFWTDNYNQPRRISITDAIAGKYSGTYIEDLISVAQYAPPTAPKVRMSYDSSIKSKHIEDKFVKFAYRFQYENNEYSVISPFTQTCFHPGKDKDFNFGVMSNTAKAGTLTAAQETEAIEQTTVEMVQNLANVVDLFIDLPGSDVYDKDNHAACNVNQVGGASGSSPYNIDTVNGTIVDGNTVVTERGDNYIAAIGSDSGDGNGTATLGTTVAIDAKTPLLDNQRLYFFSSITDYANNLKIKKIQILYSEAGSLALKVIDTIDFEKQVLSDEPGVANSARAINNIIFRAEPLADNNAKLIYGFKYTYNSTKPIQTLPESELLRISDIIPVKAKTQEVSGNRVIYGNFWQNRDVTGLDPDQFSITSGDQTNFNPQYLLSSVKSNREYSVGIVLSDRYGRMSPVITPTDNTEFLDPKNGSVASWAHYALKLDFTGKIGDAYVADTNPLGWYSYRVVVKQTEQEYYNVFAPTLLDNIPSDEKRTWLVLSGDNINKVPRDVTDINTEDGTQGSQTSLLPKVLDTSGTQAQQNGTDYIDIISIGTKNEHGIGTSINDFYLNDKNPLLAELPDGQGRNHISGSEFDNLIVLETKPISTALDIYYETSTAGLISHLNEQIDSGLTGSVPNALALSANTVAESAASGTKAADLTTTDSSGSTISTPTYSIVSIVDGNGSNRAGAFVIDGEDLDTGETFEFKNNNEDSYTITIKSTKGSNSQNFTKTVTITNVAPTQTVGSSLTLAASTNVGANVRTITAVNGSAKTSANGNSLTFSIESGNTDNDFTINSSTGIIQVANSLTSGDSYTLGIRTTDVGGLQDNDNLSVTISAANYTSFYLSEGDSSGIPACDRHVGTLRYHSGSSATPSQGDTVFTDAQGTTAFNGSNETFAWAPGGGAHNGSGASFIATINGSGVVGSVTLCS
jgi:hypothetical protein